MGSDISAKLQMPTIAAAPRIRAITPDDKRALLRHITRQRTAAAKLLMKKALYVDGYAQKSAAASKTEVEAAQRKRADGLRRVGRLLKNLDCLGDTAIMIEIWQAQ